MTSDTTTTISIEIDTAELTRYTPAQLATAWHVAQANPGDGFAEQRPGGLAELIGREIIRRWLRGVEPELYRHQGKHYYLNLLRQLGSWEDGTFVPTTTQDTPTGGAQ